MRRTATRPCSPAPSRADFPDDVGEDDLAGLFYTGGTTGAAKGVMLRHRSLVANAMHVQAVWPFDAETRFLLVAPMFHLAGTLAVLATVWHGARQVVMRAFDPAGLLDLVERERITATQVVPSMLAAISEEQLARPRDVSSLRFLTFGGAPSATETLRRAHRAFPDAELMTMYGATETAPLVTAVRHVERRLDTPQARTCGQPLVGVEARIVDPDDRTPVARGEVGEVAVRGPNVMPGYWDKPDQTAAALVDGWYHTGDLGRLDDEGYLYLVDRAKDMIVSGGENVYSTEVEDVLYRHPAVLEAAVFGVPDERWGEAVHAVVVPRVGRDRGRPGRPLPAVDRRLQGPQAHRDPRRAAAEIGRRQAAEARAAGAVLGRARVDGVGRVTAPPAAPSAARRGSRRGPARDGRACRTPACAGRARRPPARARPRSPPARPKGAHDEPTR